MALDPFWYYLLVAMLFCFVICISMAYIQRKAFLWYASITTGKKTAKNRREQFCLYGIYFTASLCSIQCLFNHISNFLPEWYCFYGMSVCVIFHETAKTFQYCFFLERAKSTLSTTKLFNSREILPPIITKYVLPIFIALYFLLYSILCPLTFRGLSVDPVNSSVPTACLFDTYKSWVFYLSVGVEVFNSIFFVWLFAYPLYQIVNSDQHEAISIIKHNIIFSSLSCTSSVMFLFYRAFARGNRLSHFLWLAGNVDLVINTICTFAMVTVNRRYMQYLHQDMRTCKCRRTSMEKEESYTSNQLTTQNTLNNCTQKSLPPLDSLCDNDHLSQSVIVASTDIIGVQDNDNNDNNDNRSMTTSPPVLIVAHVATTSVHSVQPRHYTAQSITQFNMSSSCLQSV